MKPLISQERDESGDAARVHVAAAAVVEVAGVLVVGLMLVLCGPADEAVTEEVGYQGPGNGQSKQSSFIQTTLL